MSSPPSPVQGCPTGSQRQSQQQGVCWPPQPSPAASPDHCTVCVRRGAKQAPRAVGLFLLARAPPAGPQHASIPTHACTILNKPAQLHADSVSHDSPAHARCTCTWANLHCVAGVDSQCSRFVWGTVQQCSLAARLVSSLRMGLLSNTAPRSSFGNHTIPYFTLPCSYSIPPATASSSRAEAGPRGSSSALRCAALRYVPRVNPAGNRDEPRDLSHTPQHRTQHHQQQQ